MNRGTRAWLLSVALVASSLTAAVGLGRTAQAQTQGAGPVQVAQAFIDAFNSGNLANLQAVADPSFRFVSDPGTPEAEDLSFDQFVKENLMPGNSATLSNLQQTGPDTATAEATLKPGPPVDHPFVVNLTFTITNGKVSRIVSVTSAHSLQDASALGPPPGGMQPGMPRTGAPDPTLPLSAAFAGLLLLAAGLLTRRVFVAKK